MQYCKAGRMVQSSDSTHLFRKLVKEGAIIKAYNAMCNLPFSALTYLLYFFIHLQVQPVCEPLRMHTCQHRVLIQRSISRGRMQNIRITALIIIKAFANFIWQLTLGTRVSYLNYFHKFNYLITENKAKIIFMFKPLKLINLLGEMKLFRTLVMEKFNLTPF